MLYSCTHIATVDIKGLSTFLQLARLYLLLSLIRLVTCYRSRCSSVRWLWSAAVVVSAASRSDGFFSVDLSGFSGIKRHQCQYWAATGSAHCSAATDLQPQLQVHWVLIAFYLMIYLYQPWYIACCRADMPYVVRPSLCHSYTKDYWQAA